MTDQLNDVTAVLAELGAAATLVAELRDSISSGDSVDLAAFNAKIETACKAAVSLPREQISEIRQPLDQLLESLNGAKADIETARADLAKEAGAAG